jgi:hypothetical protein
MMCFPGIQFRDGIKSAGMKRVATADAPDRQPATTQGAVTFECFKTVFGTGWMETALVTQPWAQHQAITLDEKYQEPLHFRINLCQ